MDAFFHSATAMTIILAFSITNIVLGILVFFTCRCMPGFQFSRGLMHNKTYLKFYKYHCYLWLFFLVSVMIHAVFAINFAR
jgi:hypothetical protein